MGFVPFMKDTSGSQASSASGAEKRRNALIDQGTAGINAIYNGGSYPIYSTATTYNPQQSYYQQKGNGTYQQVNINPGNGAKKIGSGKFFTMQQSPVYSGFNNDFYNQRAQDYVNYAMPQLSHQYHDTANSLGYGLANRGLLGGSANEKANSDLNYQMAQSKQNIYDTGRSSAQQLKTSVENARQQAINNLYQSANPGEATQSALSAASNFQSPSVFTPIANSFNNLLNQYYANKVLNSYSPGAYYGGQNSNYANPQPAY